MTFPVNPVTALPHEVHEARLRPVPARTPLPVKGQRVWYRHDKGGPVTPAEVESVDLSNREDWNVWRVVTEAGRPVEVAGKRVTEMVADPWPDVFLRTEYGRVVTREARIEGSPGWIPVKK